VVSRSAAPDRCGRGRYQDACWGASSRQESESGRQQGSALSPECKEAAKRCQGIVRSDESQIAQKKEMHRAGLRLRPDLRLTAAEATATRITLNLRRSVLGARTTLAVVDVGSRARPERMSQFARNCQCGKRACRFAPDEALTSVTTRCSHSAGSVSGPAFGPVNRGRDESRPYANGAGPDGRARPVRARPCPAAILRCEFPGRKARATVNQSPPLAASPQRPRSGAPGTAQGDEVSLRRKNAPSGFRLRRAPQLTTPRRV